MNTLKSLAIVFCVSLFLLASSAQADEWNKLTTFTFSAPVRVGDTTLPAGTYTFKLVDLAADRNFVEIFNDDGTHLITTVRAVPDYRVQPTGNTAIKFAETSGGQQTSGEVPDSGIPIKEWFYPGDNFGQEFPVVPAEVAAVQPEPAPAPAPAPQVETPAPVPETAALQETPAPTTARPGHSPSYRANSLP